MAVAFRSKGAWCAGTTSVSFTMPTTHAVGDLLLMFIHTCNNAITTAPGNGWALLSPSPVSTGTANTALGVRLTVYWKIAASSSEAAQTVGVTSGTATNGLTAAFSGVDTTTPFDVTPTSGVQATSVANFTCPTITTATDGAMVVNAVALDNDTNSSAIVTAQTNASLVSMTQGHGQTVTTGTGGGVWFGYGIDTTAGSVNGTAGTVAAAARAMLTIALRPLGLVVKTGSVSISQASTVVVTGTKKAAYAPTTSAAGSVVVTGTKYEPPAPMPAPTYRASAEAYNAAANSLTVNKPTGTVNGDIMLAFAYCNAPADVITPPAGWDVIQTINTTISGRMTVYAKKAKSEGSSYVFGFDSVQRCRVSIHSFYGADATSFINASSVNVTVSSVDVVASSITTTAANCLLVFLCGSDNTLTIAYGPPADMTERFDSGVVPSGHEVATVSQATAGASGDKTGSSDYATTGVAFLIALAPPSVGEDLMDESFEGTGYELVGWSATAVDPDSTDITPPENGGSQTLKATMTASAASVYRSISTANVLITYNTFWVYVSSEGFTNNMTAYLARCFANDWTGPSWGFKLYKDSGGVLRFWFAPYTGGATPFSASAAAISTGVWYKIKVLYDATNHLYSCSYATEGGSDILITSGTLTDVHKEGSNIFFIGSTDLVTYTAYFDRVKVGSTGFFDEPVSDDRSGSVSISQASTVAVTAIKQATNTVSMTTAGTVTITGQKKAKYDPGTAAVTGITVTGKKKGLTTTTTSAAGSVVVTARGAHSNSVVINQASTIVDTGRKQGKYAVTTSAAGTVTITGKPGSKDVVSINQASTVVVAGRKGGKDAATINQASTIVDTGRKQGKYAVTTSASGTVTVAGKKKATYTTSTTGTGSVVVTGGTNKRGLTAINQASTVVVTVKKKGLYAVVISAAGTVVVTGTKTENGDRSVTINQASTIAVTGRKGGKVSTTTTSTGSVVVGVRKNGKALVSMTASGSMIASAKKGAKSIFTASSVSSLVIAIRKNGKYAVVVDQTSSVVIEGHDTTQGLIVKFGSVSIDGVTSIAGTGTKGASVLVVFSAITHIHISYLTANVASYIVLLQVFERMATTIEIEYPVVMLEVDYDVVMAIPDNEATFSIFENIVTTEVSGMAYFDSTITIRATFPASAGDLSGLTNVHCEVYDMNNTLVEDVKDADVTKLSDGVYEIDWLLTENIMYAFFGTLGTRILVGKAKVKGTVPV